jgi:tetratricopeptide (TPR) repeat protein
MKMRVIIIACVSLLAGIAFLGLILTNDSQNGDTLDIESLSRLSAESLENQLRKTFASDQLPRGQEEELLVWLFDKHPRLAESLVRESAQQVSRLPSLLSNTALSLLKSQNPEASIATVSLARELFPNNPDVLGIMGVIAYIGGSPAEARRFLEEAESWGQSQPIVDFYLGGILVQASNVAERSRGKSLLMRVVSSQEEEYSELAGLILLSDPSIPLIDKDVDVIFQALKASSAFHADNPKLTTETLRVIINRLIPFKPAEALELAEILIRKSDDNDADRLGIIQLAQDMGYFADAREQLDKLKGAVDPSGDSPEARRMARTMAVQLIAEEKFEEGLEAFMSLVEKQPQDPALRNAFDTVLDQNLPVRVEVTLLRLFLGLPVENVRNALIVLSRLVELEPLREQEWIDFAKEKLLESAPVAVSQWLMEIGAEEVVVETFSSLSRPLDEKETLALVESYLAGENPDAAEGVLARFGDTLDPAIREFLYCRLLVQQGLLEEAFDKWKSAHQLAMGGQAFPLVKNLGFLALQMDQEVNALQSLYTAFSAGVPFTEDQANQLLSLTLSFGNLQQSMNIAEFMVKNDLEDPYNLNNLLYFQFLAEVQIDESVEKMRELVENYPDIYQFQLTLALGLIKAGRTNEASRLVQSTRINWEEAGTRSQMIYAVVLAASNQRVVAEGLIRNINTEELIPEEMALLEAF